MRSKAIIGLSERCDGGSQKRGQNGAEVAPIPVLTLSLLMGGFAQNGPEPSRARRCWARRSEPLTARTVLRRWSKRERGAKGWGAKMAPSLGASNTVLLRHVAIADDPSIARLPQTVLPIPLGLVFVESDYLKHFVGIAFAVIKTEP